MNRYEFVEESGEIIKSKCGDWVMWEEAEEAQAEKDDKIAEINHALLMANSLCVDIEQSIKLIEEGSGRNDDNDVLFGWECLKQEVAQLKEMLK